MTDIKQSDDLFKAVSAEIKVILAEPIALTAERLFTKSTASKYFTTFLVGQEKIPVYGNPVIMARSSIYFNNLLEFNECTETLELLTDIKITEYPLQFVLLWSYLNGISNFSNTLSKAKLDEIFRFNELHDYFGTAAVYYDQVADAIHRETRDWRELTTERIQYINRFLVLASRYSVTKYTAATNIKNMCRKLLDLEFSAAKK